MPVKDKSVVIVVHGVSSAVHDKKAISSFLGWYLPEAAESVEGVNIKAELVTVHATAKSEYNGTSGVGIFVYMREEHAPEALQELAEAIRDCAVKFIAKHGRACSVLEVFVRPRLPGDGFAEWRD